MSTAREDIVPNPPRWKPNSNPATIQIPGLDTTAPVHDQIEQIEQLITIKLQNIDENFSRIHHVLANKLLPAVKRYAAGTEPVREAAKFWTSFYEQAAQIRIPTSDDLSTVNEFPSENEVSSVTSDHTVQDETVTEEELRISREESTVRLEEPSTTTTESSFHPNQDALSSTPAQSRAPHAHEHNNQGIESPSWTTSMESPFVRLSNEVKNFSLDEEDPSFTPSTTQNSTLRSDESTQGPITKQSSSRKGKNTPLRENLLRRQLHSTSDMSSIAITAKNISPLKPRHKPKTPISQKHNPYIPAGADPSKWDGVVDLRDPRTTTPRRSHRSQASSSSRKTAPAPLVHSDDDDDSDDDFDTMPLGMSPPVMMSPVRRKVAESSLLAPTPSKNASARIRRDILRSVQKGRHPSGTSHSMIESSLSTMPTPPSFSQYRDRGGDITDSITDPSFDSMMRRVGLDVSASTGPAIGGIVDDNAPQVYDDLSSDDSLDDIDGAAGHPSAAFLMATQGIRASDDDSFDSSNQSTDSLNDEEAHLDGAVPVHPFAGGIEDTGDDDSVSFEDYPPAEGGHTETLFGVAPGQRLAIEQHRGQQLRMLGQEMLDDMTATGAYVGGVEESPTPANWAGSR